MRNKWNKTNTTAKKPPNKRDEKIEEYFNELIEEIEEEEEEDEEEEFDNYDSEKTRSRAYTVITCISIFIMLLLACNSVFFLIDGSKSAKTEILKSPEEVIRDKVKDILEMLPQPSNNFGVILSNLNFLGSSINTKDTSVLVKKVIYSTKFISSLMLNMKKISNRCEDPVIVQLVIHILHFLHDFVLSGGRLRTNDNSAIMHVFKSCGENVLIIESFFSFLYSIIHSNKEVNMLKGIGKSILTEAVNLDSLLGYQKSLILFAEWNKTVPLREDDNIAACSLLDRVLKLPSISVDTKKIIGLFYQNVMCKDLYTEENEELLKGFSEL